MGSDVPIGVSSGILFWSSGVGGLAFFSVGILFSLQLAFVADGVEFNCVIMDASCEFCSEMHSKLPHLGPSKVLFSIILARFHEAGHVDAGGLLMTSLGLIVELSGLRLEVAQAKQFLLAKEVTFLD